MKAYLLPLLAAVCYSQADLNNYGCKLLCRHEGLSDEGIYSEKIKDCLCLVPGNFEALREKRLIWRSKKISKEKAKDADTFF